MIDIPMKRLLETGVHFGHQPRRWNPKMDSYIFTERKGVHIIDLEQTIEKVKQVTEMVTQHVADGDDILFVGTKRQAQESLEEEARRCGMPYVCNRWLGGTLTNFNTIRKSVEKLQELERMEEEDIMDRLSNKEARSLQREKNRLLRNLEGIRDMESLPDMVFITDLVREDIAVKEANKLEIPIVGILDSNVDPERVDYGIPGNDDAIRALSLYSEIMADAVIEGKEIRQKRIAEEKAAMQAEQVEEEDIPAEAEVIEHGEDEEEPPAQVAEKVEQPDEQSTGQTDEDTESSSQQSDDESEEVAEEQTDEDETDQDAESSDEDAEDEAEVVSSSSN